MKPIIISFLFIFRLFTPNDTLVSNSFLRYLSEKNIVARGKYYIPENKYLKFQRRTVLNCSEFVSCKKIRKRYKHIVKITNRKNEKTEKGMYIDLNFEIIEYGGGSGWIKLHYEGDLEYVISGGYSSSVQ